MSNEGADATDEHGAPGNYTYDVFISCSDDHSRSKNFTNHLYNALIEKKIMTFMDDPREQSGDEIPHSVLEAIEESWISIVVLSNNYASSIGCLNQLVKIIQCQETVKQMVYPIFYDVDPSDVRHLRGSYGKAMDEHANRFGSDSKKVQDWRSALSRVANISGWIYRYPKENEYGFIERLVGFIAQHLFRYEVFVSFRGQDTGYTFTGNLCNALRQKKIKTFFIDNNNELWKKGPRISRRIQREVAEARISIVVLSETYASSTWCLEELSHIIHRKKMMNHLVWPIFYKEKPSDVRKQNGNFKMDAHINEFGNDPNSKVHNWTEALTEVANFTGFPFENGYEYELIQRIVELAVQSLSRYDVFLSFSWEDTGHTFSGYLYNALCQKGFKTFMDDEGMEDGNNVSQRAIENSRHLVVVFSENYAYSSWCLDELVNILECKKRKTKDHVVWPIFYKVEPSHVRDQRSSYGHAIAAHEKVFGKDSDKVRKWKSALSKIPYLGGYYRNSEDIYNKTEHENELIKQIVEHLSFPHRGELDPGKTPSTGGFTIGLHHQQG